MAEKAFSEVRGNRWRWSNPLPHGNNVLDMYVNADIAVQVGDGGTIYLRRSDKRWAPVVSGVSNYLRSVTMLGERFIVSGEGGCILWSDDGASFQSAQLSEPTSDWFEGVASSGSRAVAAGDNGSIYTSTDGVNWTKVTSNTSEWLRGVAFGGGAFVAAGENGRILRSTNGILWSPIDGGTSRHLNRVRYLRGTESSQFVAVGNGGTVLSSATGTAPWTSLNSGTTNDLYDVALNQSGMLVVGDQEVRFRAQDSLDWVDQVVLLSTNAPPAWVYLTAHGSADSWMVAGRAGLLIEGTPAGGGGYEWQPYSDSPHAWLWDVTVQNGIYVAVGDLACIQTSIDGILWAREVVPVSHTDTVLLGVGGTTNLLLAVGNAGKVLISRAGTVDVTITNFVGDTAVVTHEFIEGFGIVWSNLPSFTDVTLQGVAAADHLFIVSGDSGKIFSSSDAVSWVEQSTPTANFLSSIAIGPSACVAVGANGTLLRSGPSGDSWEAVEMATTDWLYRVRWVGDRFVVAGQNGRIYTSPDGLIWTSRTSGTTTWLTDISYVDDTWFITGYQGTLLLSTNLANWTSVPVPTIKSLFSTSTQNGQLVVAGVEGVILRNQFVPHLSPIRFIDYNQNTVISSGSTNVYELFLFGGLPDQFFQFESCTNLTLNQWSTNAVLEMFDPTIYLLQTRDAADTPPSEFYRTQLLP